MMSFLKKEALFSLLFYSSIASCTAQVDVYDGFEKPQLNKIWTTDRMVSGAFKVQSSIVRKGQSAAMISLKAGDVFEAGIGKSKDSERDELREGKKLASEEGKIYEYQFSLFLPDSFPVVPTRLVIAQWKQHCGGDDLPCADDSPVMAIRYVSGELSINIQTDSSKKNLYRTTEEIRNKWLDFRFKVRFSRSGNGFVEGWMNEKQIIDFKGTNCYTSKKGYGDKSDFYFKMGLYRNLMSQPMTIYIDEYRKKELTE